MEGIDISELPILRVYEREGNSIYTYNVPCEEADIGSKIAYAMHTTRVSPNQVLIQPHLHDGVLKPCGLLSELVTDSVHRSYERLLKRYIYLEES